MNDHLDSLSLGSARDFLDFFLNLFGFLILFLFDFFRRHAFRITINRLFNSPQSFSFD